MQLVVLDKAVAVCCKALNLILQACIKVNHSANSELKSYLPANNVNVIKGFKRKKVNLKMYLIHVDKI